MPQDTIFDNLPEHYPVNFIINNFDFEKVHQYMLFDNWTWFNVGVPTITQLKHCATRLLEDLRSKNDETWSIATGGFEAQKRDNRLSLTFSIVHWDEYDLEELGDELSDEWKN